MDNNFSTIKKFGDILRQTFSNNKEINTSGKLDESIRSIFLSTLKDNGGSISTKGFIDAVKGKFSNINEETYNDFTAMLDDIASKYDENGSGIDDEGNYILSYEDFAQLAKEDLLDDVSKDLNEEERLELQEAFDLFYNDIETDETSIENAKNVLEKYNLSDILNDIAASDNESSSISSQDRVNFGQNYVNDFVKNSAQQKPDLENTISNEEINAIFPNANLKLVEGKVATADIDGEIFSLTMSEDYYEYGEDGDFIYDENGNRKVAQNALNTTTHIINAFYNADGSLKPDEYELIFKALYKMNPGFFNNEEGTSIQHGMELFLLNNNQITQLKEALLNGKSEEFLNSIEKIEKTQEPQTNINSMTESIISSIKQRGRNPQALNEALQTLKSIDFDNLSSKDFAEFIEKLYNNLAYILYYLKDVAESQEDIDILETFENRLISELNGENSSQIKGYLISESSLKKGDFSLENKVLDVLNPDMDAETFVGLFQSVVNINKGSRKYVTNHDFISTDDATEAMDNIIAKLDKDKLNSLIQELPQKLIELNQENSSLSLGYLTICLRGLENSSSFDAKNFINDLFEQSANIVQQGGTINEGLAGILSGLLDNMLEKRDVYISYSDINAIKDILPNSNPMKSYLELDNAIGLAQNNPDEGIKAFEEDIFKHTDNEESYREFLSFFKDISGMSLKDYISDNSEIGDYAKRNLLKQIGYAEDKVFCGYDRNLEEDSQISNKYIEDEVLHKSQNGDILTITDSNGNKICELDLEQYAAEIEGLDGLGNERKTVFKSMLQHLPARVLQILDEEMSLDNPSQTTKRRIYIDNETLDSLGAGGMATQSWSTHNYDGELLEEDIVLRTSGYAFAKTFVHELGHIVDNTGAASFQSGSLDSPLNSALENYSNGRNLTSSNSTSNGGGYYHTTNAKELFAEGFCYLMLGERDFGRYGGAIDDLENNFSDCLEYIAQIIQNYAQPSSTT